jgi:AbrB family looped-hinge helix DNA binding protein
MVRARITSKGQLTIPVEVRRKYGLEPGDEVAFHLEANGARLLPLKRRQLTELFGALPATRKFAGRDRIRKEVGRKLGEALSRQPS